MSITNADRCRRYRAAHREELNAKAREWNKVNAVKHRADAKKWREENPARYRAALKKWQAAHKEYRREYNKIWRRNNKKKIAAHDAVGYALRKGRLQKQPCSVCGESRAEAHHRDYSKPLEVIWLCSHHHHLQHTKRKGKGK